MNTKYGKLTNGQIEYAPDVLTVDGALKVNPSEASYLAAGWKKVVNVPPAPEEGMDVMPSAWTEDETSVTLIYKQVPHVEPETPDEETPEPEHRTFSKLKVVLALKAANLWILTRTWIEENGLYDLYLAAQDFAEDNEYFLRGKEELKALLGKTDEEIEAILAECVAN